MQHFSTTAQSICRVTIPSLVRHGYVGVDFVFVLCGFIMASTYAASFRQREMAAYGPFVARRLGRSIPLNVAVLCVLYVYMIDRIELPGGQDGVPSVVNGKAFHSIYFEVLLEQGWVELGLFGLLIATSLLQLRAVARLTKGVEQMTWAHDLAISLQMSLVTILTC